MTHYTNIEIYSIGLLLFFFFLLLHTLHDFFRTRNIATDIVMKGLLEEHKTLNSLKKLSWYDFELAMMELFAHSGWEVRGNEKKGADGGVDIWLKKGRTSAIVQCKRYENAPVTIKVIREMYGLKHEYDVDEVYIGTTSRFTKECQPFAKGKKMTLIDGKALMKLIAKHIKT